MTKGRKVSRGWKFRWQSAALLAGVLTVGCLGEQSLVDIEPESLWEATLVPTAQGSASDLPRVTGQAAVAVLSAGSRIGIGVEGADRDLYWGIFRDTCDEPGARLLAVDAFPRIPEGMTEIEVTLPLTMNRSGEYHIRIGADPEIDVLLACGNFAEREF